MSRIVFSIWSLLSLGLLSACGFEPVYAERSAASQPVSIAVAGDTREAYTLRRALETALPAPGGAPAYRLDARVTLQREPALIGRDGRADRYNLVIGVPYKLSDANGGTVVDEGIATAYVSYSVPESDFAAFSAERKSVEEGIGRAAQDVRLRVIDRLTRLQAP